MASRRRRQREPEAADPTRDATPSPAAEVAAPAPVVAAPAPSTRGRLAQSLATQAASPPPLTLLDGGVSEAAPAPAPRPPSTRDRLMLLNAAAAPEEAKAEVAPPDKAAAEEPRAAEEANAEVQAAAPGGGGGGGGAPIALPGVSAAALPQNTAAKTEDPAPSAEGGGEATGKPAAAAAAAGAAGAAPALMVEPRMPPPPSALGPEASARLASAEAAAGETAVAETTMPPASAATASARAAVTEPTEQKEAEASQDLVVNLEDRPPPSPEIEELCQKIYKAIKDKRPPDEDSLLESKPEEAAAEAGGQLNDSIEGDAERVGDEYGALDEGAAPDAAAPGTPVEGEPVAVDGPEIDAEGAAPDPVPAEDLSLDADVEASEADMEEAGMNTEPAMLVQDGPLAEGHEAQGELEETAKRDPAVVMAEQQAAIDNAQGDMMALQAAALAAMSQSRATTVGGQGDQQLAMVGSEEQMRAAAGQRANDLFQTAQDQVGALLEPLATTAMAKWDAGLPALTRKFRDRLDKVQAWIDERHSGLIGFLTSGLDAVFGYPSWVVDEYDIAEKEFGDGVCDLIRDISRDVNAVIAAAEAIIEDARKRIDEVFASLPEELQGWAAEQQAGFSERLDGLNQQVLEAQQNFNKDLSERAAGAVQDVREEINSLRVAAGGLLGQIAAAIAAFLKDPIKFIINGLLSLVGIPPSAFWRLVDRLGDVIGGIADDPLGFASNLMDALKQGFDQFFGNIGDHLLQGLLDWLFSGLGSVGVNLPRDFSLKSIITFFLELMGLTWPNIRQILVKYVGEDNVALIEKAWEILSTLIKEGPGGLFEMIKKELDPATIFQMVMDAAIEFVIEALITKVTVRIIAMLNPAGAILQAIEAIFRVVKWIFENAARIFSFVETIVNGAWDILNGNVGGMANAIEKALAKLIPPVIDFLAGFLGLGGLPDKVADVIKGMQEWVLGIVDKVIGFIVKQAKGLLKALGLGGTEEEEADDEAKASPEDEEAQLGKRMSVSAGDESHTIWVEVHDHKATVMAASGKGAPMENLLTSFREKANALDKDGKEEALGLIATAEQHRSALDALGDDAANDPGQPGYDPAAYQAKRSQIEDREGQLLEALRAVMKALGLTTITPEERFTIFRDTSGYAPQPMAVPRFEAVRAAPTDPAQPIKVSSPMSWQKSDFVTALGEVPGGGREARPYDAKLWDTVDRPKLIGEKAKELGIARLGTMRYVLVPPSDYVPEVIEAGAEPLDPVLEKTVNALKIEVFMLEVALGKAPGGIDERRLNELWGPPNKSTVHREWLASRFRAVHPGTHEWIPTNLIPDVINKASKADNLETAAGWIRLQTHLRSSTDLLIFDPEYKSTVVDLGDGITERGLQGHSGALYVREIDAKGKVRYVAQTVGQNEWHDSLRSCFDKNGKPSAALEALERRFHKTIWSGGDPPADVVREYYRSPAGGDPVSPKDLAKQQIESYNAVQKSFDDLKGTVP